jgi:O-antigen ligase
MTIGLALGFLFSRATDKNWRLFMMIPVIVMGIAIILTSSRGGMLSLLAVVGFIVMANVLQKPASETDSPNDNKNYRRAFAFIGGGLGLILVLFSVVLLLSGDEFLLRGVGLGTQSDISNGRTHFWQIAWRIFLDYPIIGAGLDSYGYAYPNYDTWNGMFRVEQAHNDYLQILADAGILGFGCAAAFIYLLFKHGLRNIRQSSDSFRRNTAVGALAGCCGILIHSFFDFPLRTPSNALFFLTFTVLATVSINTPKRLRRKNKKHRTSPSVQK